MALSDDADMQLDPALTQAVEAVHQAGHLLLSRRGHSTVLRQKASLDDVLDIDIESEALIVDILHTAFPGDGIESEEGVIENEQSRRQWIIDPLDGSANYQHGNPSFGIAICLLMDRMPMLCAIYLPVADELYTAIRGRGAFRNNMPIHVSQIQDVRHAVIHLGDFSKGAQPDENTVRVATVSTLASKVYRLRLIGTAATDFAYVASGRADGLVMYTAHPWDLHAGTLLVMEAGGQVAAIQTTTTELYHIASNGCVHDELVTLLPFLSEHNGMAGSP